MTIYFPRSDKLKLGGYENTPINYAFVKANEIEEIYAKINGLKTDNLSKKINNFYDQNYHKKSNDCKLLKDDCFLELRLETIVMVLLIF